MFAKSKTTSKTIAVTHHTGSDISVITLVLILVHMCHCLL